MEKELREIKYVLPLTGSVFFDTVIRRRAKEIVGEYDGIEADVEDEKLIIHGLLEPGEAERLQTELGL